jgi:hypothetical protein
MNDEPESPDQPVRLHFGWLLVSAAWSWLLIALLCLTDPAWNLFFFCGLAASGCFLAFAWIVGTIYQPSLLRRPWGPWWLSVPFAGALGLLLVATGWGLALRVALSEASLNDYVTNVQAVLESGREPRWVGLFRVEEAQQYGSAVYLYTGSSFLDRHGIAYVPPGSSAPGRISLDRHIYGPWHAFTWRF